MLKAIKIRLYPSEDKIIDINKLIGSARFVYNKCLSFKSIEYGLFNTSTGIGQTNKHYIELKTKYSWLGEAHSKVMQQSMMNLEQAFSNFFKDLKKGDKKIGVGYPDFKKKKFKETCRFPSDAISSVKGNRINIIKSLKNIHFKCSVSDEKYLNKHQKEIKSGTLTKTKSGHYIFSILIDRPNKTLKKATNDVIGLDLGIKDFIVTSEGQKYENLKIKRKNEVKLSRKKKGSKNKNKTRIKLAKFHEKLNNQKEYYLHQTVNQILSENQTIGIENLNVKGMMKNHNLAKSIQEVSWSRFRTILTYKSEWYNREVIVVDRFFASTKLCSECGYKNDDLTLKDRFWICPKCGKLHDRDINSGINIKIEVIRIKIGLSSPKSTLQESKSIRSSVNEETNSKRPKMIKQ